jgi:hypothetical protein
MTEDSIVLNRADRRAVKSVLRKLQPVTKIHTVQNIYLVVTTGRLNANPKGQRTDTDRSWRKSRGIIQAIFQEAAHIGELVIRELKTGTFEVIDGGHRCRAIVEFVSNQFRLDEGFTVTLTDGTKEDIGGLYFKDLPQYLQEFFFSYELTTVVYGPETTEKQAALIFQTKNISTSVEFMERMNSWGDNLLASYIRETVRIIPDHKPTWSQHDLFQEYTNSKGIRKAKYIKDINHRLKHDHFVARMLKSAMTNTLSTGGEAEIESLWEEYGDSETGKYLTDTKSFQQMIDRMTGMLDFCQYVSSDIVRRLQYGATEHKLVMIARLYWYFTQTYGDIKIENVAEFEKAFHSAWVKIYPNSSQTSRWGQVLSGKYKGMVGRGDEVTFGGAFKSFLADFARQDKIEATVTWFLEAIEFDKKGLEGIGLVSRDPKRGFSQKERESKLIAQSYKCFVDGNDLNLEDAEAAHIEAWSNGGSTTVKNLVMVRRKHNRTMGSMNVMDYRYVYRKEHGLSMDDFAL